MATVPKIMEELELVFKNNKYLSPVSIQNFQMTRGPPALGLSWIFLRSNHLLSFMTLCYFMASIINNIKALVSDFN